MPGCGGGGVRGCRASVTGSWRRGRHGWRGYLRRAGAGPEQVVGLCLDRGADMVIAMAGVWLAGAAYLPLDPGYPAARLGYMLAASQARLVVTRGGLPQGWPPRAPRWWTWRTRPSPRGSRGCPPVRRCRCGWRGTAGVRDLHVGVDGDAEGGRGHARRAGEYLAWVPSRLVLGPGPGGAGSCCCSRRLDDLGCTDDGGRAGAGGVLVHRFRPASVADPGVVAGCLRGRGIDYLKAVPSHLAALAGGAGLGGVLPGRSLVLGGEAAAPGWAAGLVGAAAGRRWTTTTGRPRPRSGPPPRRLTRPDGTVVPVGAPGGQHPGVRAGSVAGPGAGRGGRGAVHRRGAAGPRVPAPARG